MHRVRSEGRHFSQQVETNIDAQDVQDEKFATIFENHPVYHVNQC